MSESPVSIAQTPHPIVDELGALARAGCDAVVGLDGLGSAAVHRRDVRSFLGWVGLEQYDETNPVGQAFLDHFEDEFGRLPEYYLPVCIHDISRALARALGSAQPLSPRGVVEALERVKMMPAASGAPGTRVSFGKWTRRGWMGSSYLVARSVEPDLRTTVLRGHLD